MQTREIDATAVQALMSAAVAAPSIHNTQPWRFGLDPDSRSIEVRADRRRPLPLADPDLRAQHVSVGAAVFNLRVAAAHLGWNPVVRLLPAPDDPDLLATVQLTAVPAADGQPSCRDLYEAVERRHTSRMPFTGRPVPDPVVAEMISSARAEGAHLDVPDIMGTRRLLRLTQAAEARNAGHPARTAEAHTWITAPRADTAYGIPLTALGPRDMSGRMPMRDFTGSLSVPRLPALRFERHAQVALLWTLRDRREDWLRAGQALEHVLLTATVHGVRTSMLHQAMEWPDLRAAMDGSGRRCSPQLLIRFGTARTVTARRVRPRTPCPVPPRAATGDLQRGDRTGGQAPSQRPRTPAARWAQGTPSAGSGLLIESRLSNGPCEKGRCPRACRSAGPTGPGRGPAAPPPPTPVPPRWNHIPVEEAEAMVRSVVVGLDGSAESRAAAEWAAREAKRRFLPLKLVHVWELVPAPMALASLLGAETQQRWGERLPREAAEELRLSHPGLNVTVEQVPGRPAEVLTEAAKDAELLVLGSRGMSGIGGFLVGSVGQAVVGHAEQPVVLVRAGEQAADGQAMDPSAIPSAAALSGPVVLGLDTDNPDDTLLTFAFEAAARRVTPLRVVHAWNLPPYFAYGLPDDPELNAVLAKQDAVALAEVLHRWKEKYPAVKVVEESRPGSPAVRLVDASREASLVVVGRRIRRGPLGAHIGPVTHAVLHHATAPVAVVAHD